MKVKFILPICISLLVGNAVYGLTLAKPEKCPNAKAIAAVGLSFAKGYDNGKWMVAEMNNRYGTHETWMFAIGFLEAKDEQEAFAKANAELPLLQNAAGPVYLGEADKWGCTYTTVAGYLAAAVTPPQPINSH